MVQRPDMSWAPIRPDPSLSSGRMAPASPKITSSTDEVRVAVVPIAGERSRVELDRVSSWSSLWRLEEQVGSGSLFAPG